MKPYLTPKPKYVVPLKGQTTLGSSLRFTLEVRIRGGDVLEVARDFLPLKVNGGGVKLALSDDLSLVPGDFSSRLAAEGEGYALIVRDQITVISVTRKGLINGLASLRQLILRHGKKLNNVLIVDYPSFKYRGVVEGFYHEPWTWSNRRYILGFMARVKMNAYIYAPKNDPYHREKWRAKYPQATLGEIKALVRSAEKYGVRFFFAVSPGLSVKYSSKLDEDYLVDKFLRVARLGVRSFAVFYDDISLKLIHDEDKERYSSLAEAQADFTNTVYRRLREELQDVEMLLCPTEYKGTGLSEYFSTLVENLDKRIGIMWTGPQTCSREITYSDAARVRERSKGRLFIWDNYPVNDYSRNRLNLGPLRSRDSRLHEVVEGVFFNPMNEAYASTIPLATCADYAWNPEDYDPDASWRTYLSLEYGDRAEDLIFLASQVGESLLWPKPPREAGYADSLLRGVVPSELEDYFYRLSILKNTLRNLDPLYGDLEKYLYKLHLYGISGLNGLKALHSCSSSEAWTYLVRMLKTWSKARGIAEIAGYVSLHEEPIWRTSITRAFLDKILCFLARLVLSGRGIGLLVPLITSTMDHLEGLDISKAFDGDPRTYFTSMQWVKGGEEVVVDLDGGVEVDFVTVKQAPLSTHNLPKLQVYVLKDTWLLLGVLTEGNLEVRGRIRGLRLRVAERRDERLCLREVTLRRKHPKIVTDMRLQTSAYNIVDGRADTFLEAVNVEEKSRLTIDLGRPRRVRKLRVLQDPDAAAPLKVRIAPQLGRWREIGYAYTPYAELPVNSSVILVELEVIKPVKRLRVHQVQLL